jgi:hypothetical protein
MNNSKDVKADSQEKNVAVVNGENVDTSTGEVLKQNTENKAEKEKTETEKRPMTESEAREYIASLGFKHINVKELYEVMQVPSCSRYEFRMAAYIILWARKNGIDYKFDKKGNVYLTKGKLEEGEFYPCVTAHMDTVQDKAKPYALAGAELPLRTRRVKSTTTDECRHEIYIDGQGIGADDKLGVYISLQLVSKFDKIKAAFFVEEEIGMQGSKELDKDFFNDVAYVIGWDSPDLIRAAWKCSGTQLFTADFYKNHLREVVKRWGYEDKNFHSEPFTDVIQIREKTGVMCMNFGNGGYNAHMPNEFLVIEHVDHATGMGEDIIKSIGNKEQFKFTKTFTRTAGGVSPYEDERECERLFGTYSSSYNYNTNRSSSSSSSSSSANNRSDGNVNSKPAEDAVNEETVKYIVDTYDEYVKGIKEDVEKKCDIIEDIIKDKFREAGIDYSTFGVNIKKEFAEVFSKEIKF